MSKFVLTAQLQLQAPSNVGQVVQQIQNQLNGITVNIKAQGAAQAQQQVQNLSKSMQQATGTAANMGRTFALSVKRFAALSVATRGVSLFTNTLSKAVDEAISFERQLVKISQVTGSSISELSDLVSEVTRLSTGLGVSSKSLLNVSEILAQAGLSAKDTKIALDALAKSELAPTFDNITATAEGAVAILAQFKQGSAALESQLGSLNAVAGKFAVEAGDLVDVIRRTGGVFKASGGNLNELVALFTSVRATTRESAESISTGLRTIFTRIQRPKTIEFLKQFGVELTDLEGKFVGPFEAIKRLSEGLRGLGEGDITFIKIAEELGGFRQIGKVIPLLREFKTAQEALNVAEKGSKGLAQDAATAQLALAVRITKVKEEFLALARGITETKSFQVFANTALNLASSLVKLADALKPLIPLLTAVAAVKIAKGLGSFIGGFKGGVGFNQGGVVHKFARGGLVPGSGNSDTVPAMLQPGEFVIRKSSVNKLGAGNLAAMNANRFALGGQARKFGIASLLPMDKPLDEVKGNIPISNIRSYLAKKSGGKNLIKRGNLENVDNTIRGILGLQGKQSVQTSAIAETISRQDVAQKIEKRVELSIQKLIDASASALGKSLSIQIARKADNSIVKSVGSASTVGSVFEGALSMLGAPMDTSKSEQDPIDFPNGLGPNFASAFKSLAGIPVDAKRTATKKILKDTANRKAASYLANAVYSNPIWQSMSNINTQKTFDRDKKYMLSELGMKKSEAINAGFKKVGSNFYQLKNLGGLIQKFATGGKASRKVPYESGVGPSPFSTSKNKLDYYSLERNSGFASREFDSLVEYAKTNGLSLLEFKQYLQKRIQQKKQNSQLMMNPSSLLNAITPTQTTTTPKQTQLANMLKGPVDAKYNPKYDNARKPFATGGSVGTDTVPALLTPGEFVVNKSSAQRIGYGNLNRMNKVGKYAKGGVVQHFAEGSPGGVKGGGLFNSLAGIQPLLPPDKFQTLTQALEENAVANKRSAKAQKQIEKQAAELILAIVDANRDYGHQSDQQKTASKRLGEWMQALRKDTDAKLASANATNKQNTTNTNAQINQQSSSATSKKQQTRSQRLDEEKTAKAKERKTQAQRVMQAEANIQEKEKKGGFLGSAINKFRDEGYTYEKGVLTNAEGKQVSEKRLVARAKEMEMAQRKEALGVTTTSGAQQLAKNVAKGTATIPGSGGGTSGVTGIGKGAGAAVAGATSGGGGGKGAGGGGGITGFGKFNEALFGVTFALSSLAPTIDENSTSFEKGMAKTIESAMFLSSTLMGLNAVMGIFGKDLSSIKFGQLAGNLKNFATGGRFGGASNISGVTGTQFRASRLMSGNPSLTKSAAFKMARSQTGSIASQVGDIVGGGVSKLGKFGLPTVARAAPMVGRLAAGATAVAGPALAAAAAVGAINKVIGNFRDLDHSLEQATKAGNEQAVATLSAAKAASDFPLIGNIVGSIFGQAGDEFLLGISAFFGGQSADQVKTAALTQLQAGKAAKALAEATDKGAKAMKDFENGTASATDVLRATSGANAEAFKLSTTTNKQVAANEGAKSTGGFAVARDVFTLGGLLGETSTQRNRRIDKENTQLKEQGKQAQSEAFKASLPGLEVLQRQIATSGGSFEDFIAQVQAADPALAAYIQSEGAASLGLTKSFENISKEAERTRKAFDAMNLGFQNVSAASAALGTNLDNYMASQQAGNIKTESTIRTLEASVTNAAQGISDADFSSALGDASSSLRQLGASDAQVKKFEENLGAINTAQKFFASASQETKDKLKADFEAGKTGTKNLQERRGVFANVIEEQLKGAGIGEDVRKRIGNALENSQLSDTDMQKVMEGDFSVLDKTLKDLGDTTLNQVIPALKEKAKYEQVLVDLTQKRIDSENKVIEAQRGVLEAQLEAQELISKYGGKALTPEMRRENIIEQANVQRGELGVSALTTGSAKELNRRNQQIRGRLNQIGEIRQWAAAGDKGAQQQLAGQSGKQLEAEQQRLLDLAKSDYETTKKLIQLKEDELKIIGEKNKLEKDSISALISGDAEKFFELQQAKGAQAAIATGNATLQSAYGPAALGAAAQEIQRQQEAGVTELYGQQLGGAGGLTERGFGAALGARGITDARMAQVAAGTTMEEEMAKQDIRSLAETLPNNAKTQLTVAEQDKQTADIQFKAAEMQLEAAVKQVEARSGGAEIAGVGGMARGGIVYANRGIFVPRGTDTVPAMLTPGEFVVRREAVQRGNNLQLLRAMNTGSNSTSMSSSSSATTGGAVGMAKGGVVKYYAEGDMASGGLDISKLESVFTTFNTKFQEAINSLANVSLNIKLDATNVNVNLTGGEFLMKIKEDTKSELMREIAGKLANYGLNNNGRLQEKSTITDSI